MMGKNTESSRNVSLLSINLCILKKCQESGSKIMERVKIISTKMTVLEVLIAVSLLYLCIAVPGNMNSSYF